MKIGHLIKEWFLPGLMILLIAACKKSHTGPTGNPPPAKGFSLKEKFALFFVSNEELDGMAYRPANHSIYIVKGLNYDTYEILHYDLGSGKWAADFAQKSLYVAGGLRYFGDSLFVVRSIDGAIDLLRFDKNNSLFSSATFSPTAPGLSIYNCSDISFDKGNLYFINKRRL